MLDEGLTRYEAGTDPSTIVVAAASMAGALASSSGARKKHSEEIEQLFEARRHEVDQQVRKELSKKL